MNHIAMWAALADPTRRRVLESLRDGPRTVGEVVRTLEVSQPAVSQHLKVLHQAKLVERRVQGPRRLYSVRVEGLEPLLSYVESFWRSR